MSFDITPATSSLQTGAPTEGQWTTGLYDCFDDGKLCLKTCFCSCITMGQIAEIVDGGTTSRQVAGFLFFALGDCQAMYAAAYRTKLRQLFKLPEEPCNDCCVHFCCDPCALTQEYRELKNRGADPSLGWQGNMQKWEREAKMPPIPSRMARS